MLTLLLAGAADKARTASNHVARQTIYREVIDLYDLNTMRRQALASRIAMEDAELIEIVVAMGAMRHG